MKEDRGSRQGGHLSADEFKIYSNPMLKALEDDCGRDDFLGGKTASVVGLADDTAPMGSGDTPMRPFTIFSQDCTLYNIMENNFTCSLELISADYSSLQNLIN